MKKLAGLAHDLSAMVLSEAASDLYEELMDLRDGIVTIDLLARNAHLNNSVELRTRYVKKLSDWFVSRVPACGVEPKEISSALVDIQIDSSNVSCDRSNIVHYLASATTTIKIKGRCYRQSIPITHVWHKRKTQI